LIIIKLKFLHLKCQADASSKTYSYKSGMPHLVSAFKLLFHPYWWNVTSRGVGGGVMTPLLASQDLDQSFYCKKYNYFLRIFERCNLFS